MDEGATGRRNKGKGKEEWRAEEYNKSHIKIRQITAVLYAHINNILDNSCGHPLDILLNTANKKKNCRISGDRLHMLCFIAYY